MPPRPLLELLLLRPLPRALGDTDRDLLRLSSALLLRLLLAAPLPSSPPALPTLRLRAGLGLQDLLRSLLGLRLRLGLGLRLLSLLGLGLRDLLRSLLGLRLRLSRERERELERLRERERGLSLSNFVPLQQIEGGSSAAGG
jgi:hypothetical protein